MKKRLPCIFLALGVLFQCTHKEKNIPTAVHRYDFIPLPYLESNIPNVDRAWRIAMGDYTTNIIPWGSLYSGGDVKFEDSYLQDKDAPVVTAGLDYGVFSSDGVMAVWDGMAMVNPDVSYNNLLASLSNIDNRVRVGGRYWDPIVWVIGAWNYYLQTGDATILPLAYEAMTNTLADCEKNEFDSASHLFYGLAFWADGISSYPDAWAEALNGNAHIAKWPEFNKDKMNAKGYGIPMQSLSTNCLYYYSYVLTGKIARQLNKDAAPFEQKSGRLKKAINTHFWMEDKGHYRYLLDLYGGSEAQEGFGQAFAILFGIADQQQVASIFKTLHVGAHGVPCISPLFDRYKKDGKDFYANHAETLWPPIEGLWAQAAAIHKKSELVATELFSLADRACRDRQFSEIYHPVTSEIFGGYQEGVTGRKGKSMDRFVQARLGHDITFNDSVKQELFPPNTELGNSINLWQSCDRQTWSATAYVRMILQGVLGMRFTEEGIVFEPNVPEGFENIKIKNLRYHNQTLQVSITGSGDTVREFKINGVIQDSNLVALPLPLDTTIEIVL